MRTAHDKFFHDLSKIDSVARWLETTTLDPDMRIITIEIRTACVVLLSGYFESFLKEIIKAFVNEINSRLIPFQNLPEKIRVLHFENGGKVLNKQIKKEKCTGTTAKTEDLASRIASVTGTPYSLAWEAFTDTEANPKAEVVKKLLGAFGIIDPWAKMEGHLGGGSTIMKTFLDTFIEQRNECAHTGSIYSPPTGRELADYCYNFLELSQAIQNVLFERLSEL